MNDLLELVEKTSYDSLSTTNPQLIADIEILLKAGVPKEAVIRRVKNAAGHPHVNVSVNLENAVHFAAKKLEALK
jgi:hypothetical protein